MKTNSQAIKRITLAASLLSSVFFISSQPTQAQTAASPPTATATRPARAPADEQSLPNNAPTAGTLQTTGAAAGHDPVVNKMNDDEKRKLDTEGK
jgi:hypothetical protein